MRRLSPAEGSGLFLVLFAALHCPPQYWILQTMKKKWKQSKSYQYVLNCKFQDYVQFNVSKNMPENKSGDWLADTAHRIYFWHGYVVIWKGMMAKSKKDGNLSSVGGPGTCSNTLKSTHKCSQKCHHPLVVLLQHKTYIIKYPENKNRQNICHHCIEYAFLWASSLRAKCNMTQTELLLCTMCHFICVTHILAS